MGKKYELIASHTVGSGGSATVTFTSIPATYTDLIMTCSLRTARSAIEENFYMYFNSTDSGSTRVLRGSVTTADSFTAGDSFKGQINAASSTGNTFSNLSFYIPNYLSSNNKHMSLDAVMENNASTSYTQVTAGLWSNTAAITSINFRLQFSSFVQNSTFYLYGVTNT